jgi:cysteine synthase B
MTPTACVNSETGLFDDNVLTHIGNTPLLRVRRLTEALGNPNVVIYAKAEWFNPGGSVKDRAAIRIVEDAIRSGEMTPDKILLDSTSGNTGIAYAMVCAAKGLRRELVMPSNVSDERARTVRAYGGKVIFSDPLEGSDGAMLRAQEIYESDTEKYYLPCQYDNESNWRAHYDTTGVEVIKQTCGRLTHFVAGVGTGGTIVGTGRRLKEFNENVQICSVEPDIDFHGIEGLKHMETSIVPGTYDPSILDRKLYVGTEEAYQTALRLASDEGLFVGKSSGAAMLAALQLSHEMDEGVIVTVFPDGGSRYLSTVLYD